MKKLTNKKGISLIVLVITIIVMIILASAIILSLSSSGIIGKANKAKDDTNSAALKEQIELAKMDAMLASGTSGVPVEELTGTVKTNVQAAVATGYEYDNTVAAVKENEVPIPAGFVHVEGTTKDEGLIIVDASGNEFVWVPVDMEETPMFTKGADGNYTAVLYDEADGFVEEETSYANQAEPGVSSSDISYLDLFLEDGYDENEDGILQQYQDEYNAMAKSVEIYGGFYVGRYETSWTGSKVASVPGVTPMYGYTELDDILEKNEFVASGDTKNGRGSNWYTHYREQKKLYSKNSNSSVVSGMIYGSQWDAIMNWMLADKKTASFVSNSEGMGWLSIRLEDGTKQVIPGNPNYLTGLDLNGGKNKVKNIYDLSGNFRESTQERLGQSANSKNERATRGTHYGRVGTEDPASVRSTDNPAASGFRDTSRLQLYIK